MKFDLHTLKRFLLPLAFFIVLALTAILTPQFRDWLLPVLLLLLPFADNLWRLPHIIFGKRLLISWTVLVTVTSILLFYHSEVLYLFTVMVFIAALPEEWFFRAYLQSRLGNSVAAVVIVSMMFSLMHFIAHNNALAWLVFIPSLIFGWVYKKTGDLVLVVMLHALSNLMYYVYFESFIVKFFGGYLVSD